jgi:uncharacterized membrane protein
MQSFIMKAVGASTVKETKSLAGIYEEQLKKMEIVNLALSNAKYYTQITAMEYQKYIALAGSFNQSLAATEIEEFKETTAKKTAKIIMLFIFLVLAVAGGYFLFKTFIVYIAGASFAATLVGAIIICTLTVYQAVARFSQRLHSIHELLYPNIEENIQAKEKLLTFKNKKQGLDDHFEYVLSEKLSNDINRKIIKESHVSMQAEKEESFQRRNVLHPQSIHSNSQDSNCEAKEMELVPLSKDAGEATEMKENKRRAFSSYSL